jgi:hypothetical protein
MGDQVLIKGAQQPGMRFSQRIKDLGQRFWKAVAAVLILLLLILVYPFKTIVVPEWNLRVVDETGTPVRAINVTEHWQHYMFEREGHEELRQSGDDGMVKFPDRAIRASLLRRFAATLARLDKTGPEARSDPYASVVVWGSKSHSVNVAVYHPEQGPQSVVVVHTTP